MKDCCQQDINLKTEVLGKNFVCRTCESCGAKHYELEVDPLVLDLSGKDI